MAKGKKTRLHLSSYAIDPERIEREANEMAKEGWLLEKFGSLCSTYRRGEPNEYEYRVQATKKKWSGCNISRDCASSASSMWARWESI